MRWRVPLPERGNSSPIASGDHVFITQAIQKDGWRGVMCFDRSDGTAGWH